jgi:hypothetical protein
MASLGSVIRKSVTSGRPVLLNELMAILTEADPMWRFVLTVSRPDNYRELVYLSYAVEEIRAGYRNTSSHAPLSIAIENYNERMTFKETRRIVKVLQQENPDFQLSLLGLYPKERIYTNDSTGDSDLYLHDPGQSFKDAGGSAYSIDSLLGALYG